MTPIPPAELDAIVAGFTTLDFSQPLDRHRGFFVRRRAMFLSNANPAWAAASGQAALTARITNEFTQLDTYLAAKAKAFAAGTTGATTPHLDLKVLAKPKVSTSGSAAGNNERQFRKDRHDRVLAIGWRAAAIHDTLWNGAPTSPTATIQQAALDEVIDRRLHLVERMNYQVSRAEALASKEQFTTTGSAPIGPWLDGFIVRMFEYPRIPHSAVDQVVALLGGPANVAPETNPRFQSSDPAWRWEPGRRRLIYNTGPEPGIRFPLALQADWSAEPDGTAPVVDRRYYRALTPDSGTTPAQVIDQLFTPDPDWWKRSWLYCDHVISALHLEALLFARRRRDPAGGEAAFNTLAASAANFMDIGVLLTETGATNAGHLIGKGTPSDFDLASIDASDLQIGDHIIVWNTFVFGLISDSEWKLENSIVIDVDSDQKQGGINLNALKLQGHGTAEQLYANYRRDDIAGQFNKEIALVRTFVEAKFAADPGVTSLPWNGTPGRLVRWEPYETFADPGAWWIQINLTDAGPGMTWNSPTDAQADIPSSVTPEPTTPSGYHAPPSATAIYFPLYRPKYKKGWPDYLTTRKSNPAFRAARTLDPFHADGSTVPGLYFHGTPAPIPAVRPLIKP